MHMCICVCIHTHTRAHKKKGKKEGRGKTEYMERREGKTKGRDEKRSVLCRPGCLSVFLKRKTRVYVDTFW